MGKAERTREYIIEKTAQVFNRKGYAGTSMSDMTETTGLTKGAIYGNFENKDEVAMAVFEHNVAKMINRVKGLQTPDQTVTDKLKAYIEAYRNGLFDPILSAGCPIVNTGVEADDTHPGLKQKVSEAINRWHKSISAIIHQGIKAGEFREDTNVPEFASLMISMIEGGITVSKISGDINFLNQSLDHLERLIETQLKK